MLFYIGKKHIHKSSVRQCTKNVGHRVLAKCPRRENWLKDETSRFYAGQSHFEASQCPQVLGSAQDGERAGWAEPISGRDPGSRPMRERLLNAQESENRQKSVKKMFGNYEIL